MPYMCMYAKLDVCKLLFYLSQL